jgi:creatinine amidohydrolase
MGRLDYTNTSPHLAASGVDIAILPVGSTEQHGPHLPLCTDFQIAEAVAKGVADRLGAFLLPVIAYGDSDVHEGYRGSISICPETLRGLILDIGHQLQEQGFRRVAVLNTHGGNFVLRTAVRKLNRDAPPGHKVLLAQPATLATPALREIIETFDQEVHAGELETSLILHLAPEYVGDERPDCITDFGGDMYNYTLTRHITDRGVWGVSSKASAEKGARALEAMIEATVLYIECTFERLAELEGESK